MAASTVSGHLAILREAGFIYDEKENKWVNLDLNQEAANDVVKILLPLLSTWTPKNEMVHRDPEMEHKVNRNQFGKSRRLNSLFNEVIRIIVESERIM